MLNALWKLIDGRSRWVVGVSVVAISLSAWYAVGVFGDLNTQTELSLPGSESDQVSVLMAEHFDRSDSPLVVLFTSKAEFGVEDQRFADEVDRLLGTMAPDERVQSLYNTAEGSFISTDGQQTFALVDLNTDRAGVVAAVERFEAEQSSEIAEVAFGGTDITEHQMMRQVEQDLIRAELISLPIVALLLLFFFRSVVAALLPVLVGGLTIVGGMAVTRGLTHLLPIDQYAVNVITILGLGLAIDYSLLMVNRFREERDLGADVPQAVRKMVMTSGRTIFFSGLTVMTCLLCLTLFPLDFLRSVGLGAASALVVAVTTTLVILPAVLYLLGDKLDRWTLPGRRRHKGSVSQHSIWYRTGGFVLKHPIYTLVATVALIAMIAWPVKDMEFVGFDHRSLPEGTSSRQVAQDISENFRGQGAQVQILHHLENASSIDGLEVIYETVEALSSIDGVESVLSPLPTVDQMPREIYLQLWQAGQLPAQLQGLFDQFYRNEYVLLTANLDGSLTSTAERQAVIDIRNIELDSGELLVGGMAAMLTDVLDMLVEKLPLAISIMAVAMFVLFLLLLQSVVIPLKTIFINAIALMGSFGVLVLLFEHGMGSDWLWLSVTGGLQPTIPILIFVVAFGLSMDYAAFLYGRMHEEYVALKNNDQAVLNALDRTGTIITAAALLLFAVVGAFMSSKVPILQQVGVGLGVAVIIDAFVVRMFLVPSIMKLLGQWNWWAPKFLQRWQIRHE